MSCLRIKTDVISGIADVEATISNSSDGKQQLCARDPYLTWTTINRLHSTVIQLWTQHSEHQ